MSQNKLETQFIQNITKMNTISIMLETLFTFIIPSNKGINK
jgi:hypothetical protein